MHSKKTSALNPRTKLPNVIVGSALNTRKLICKKMDCKLFAYLVSVFASCRARALLLPPCLAYRYALWAGAVHRPGFDPQAFDGEVSRDSGSVAGMTRRREIRLQGGERNGQDRSLRGHGFSFGLSAHPTGCPSERSDACPLG